VAGVAPVAVNGPVKCRAPAIAPASAVDVTGSARATAVRVASVSVALPARSRTPVAGTSTSSSTTDVPPAEVTSIRYGTSAYVVAPGTPLGAVVVGSAPRAPAVIVLPTVTDAVAAAAATVGSAG
jgi:hypothetical protein